MAADATELEITLVIRAPDPARIVAQIEALDHLGAFTLGGHATFSLHDRYLDLPDGALRAARFALRLRQREGRWLLCLKGGSHRRGLAIERVEIEGAPDDAAVVERIVRAAATFGSSSVHARAVRAIQALATIDFGADPVAALQAADWVTIQDRETLRRSRDVLESGKTKSIAEFAIDTVTYVTSNVAFRHHEVEIEAVGGTSVSTLGVLAHALREAFPTALHPWRMSKLRTGAALATLAARVGTSSLAGPGGDLLPATYALLAVESTRSP